MTCLNSSSSVSVTSSLAKQVIPPTKHHMVLVVDDEYLPRETNERLKETNAINWKMGINVINDHVFFLIF